MEQNPNATKKYATERSIPALKKFSKTKPFLTLLCMLRAVCTVKAVSPDLA